mmetsp:Transcript_16123/g.56206  ORF Transcript_16123/g.56206 Transcript_16123/m.56206 type:complete len:235 (+) Transcript_16123:91-795(+)
MTSGLAEAKTTRPFDSGCNNTASTPKSTVFLVALHPAKNRTSASTMPSPPVGGPVRLKNMLNHSRFLHPVPFNIESTRSLPEITNHVNIARWSARPAPTSLFTTCTGIARRCSSSGSPMPDKVKTFGVPTAPAANSTARVARASCEAPPRLRHSTPTAAPPSRSTRAASASATTVTLPAEPPLSEAVPLNLGTISPYEVCRFSPGTCSVVPERKYTQPADKPPLAEPTLPRRLC